MDMRIEKVNSKIMFSEYGLKQGFLSLMEKFDITRADMLIPKTQKQAERISLILALYGLI